MRAWSRAGSWLVVCWGLLACDASGKKQSDAGAPGPDATTQDSGMNPTTTKVSGRIFDAETGLPLADAELRSSAGAVAVSDRQGFFELDATENVATLAASRASYAPSIRSAPSAGGYVEVFLKAVDLTVDFNAEEGVSAKLDSGATVELPAGSVRDAEGKAVTGPVTIEVTEVDGYKRTEASALPGEQKARNAEGKEGRVSVYSSLDIRIRDKEGRDLTVGSEDKVTAELPIREKDAPDNRKIFSFDEKSGTWAEEGEAQRVSKAEGDVYRAEVKHLSWWSYADFSSDLTCVRTCVKDAAGKAVKGAQVWVVGTSLPGVTSMFAGDDGCAATDLVAGSEVVLIAQSQGGNSPAQKHQTTSDIHVVSDGIEGCQDAGTLVIAAAAATACARGFSECGTACVDLDSDVRHCGACNTACEVESACILGSCSVDAATDAGMPTTDAGPVTSNAGLVAWYRFDETSGPVSDSSGNGLDGTASASGVTRGVDGKVGSAVSFGGGEIVVKASPLLDFSTAGTIEFWVMLNNTSAIGSMVSRGTGNNDDNVLVNTSCGNVQAIFSRTQPSGTTSTGSLCNLLVMSVWKHVAIVNDGTDLFVYVDAKLVESSMTGGGKLGPITSDLWIGKRENPIFPLPGALDELKWWNVARNAEQICVDAEGTWDGKTCTLP